MESARSSMLSNTPSSIDLVLEASDIALKNNNLSQLGRAYWMLGYMYEISEDVSKASRYYHQASKVYDKLSDPSSSAKLMEQSGRAKLNYGLYKLALKDYQRGIATLDEVSNSNYKLTASLLFDIGIANKKLQMYDQAVHSLLQSRRIFNLHGDMSDTLMIGKVYNELGTVYRAVATTQNIPAFYDSAINCYNKSIHFANSPVLLFRHLNNMGNLQLKRGNLTQAYIYLTDALKSDNVTDPLAQIDWVLSAQTYIPTFNNMGIIAYQQGSLQAADSLFRIAIELNARDYSIDELVRDIHLPNILNNTEELVISYRYLDSISRGSTNLAALIDRIEDITNAEKAAKAHEVELAYHEEMDMMNYESGEKQRKARSEYFGIFFTVLSIFAIILYAVMMKLKHARSYQHTFQSRLNRIKEKYT